MSTTFYAEMSTIVGHRVHCNCPDVQGETYGDYKDAGDRLVALRENQAHLDGCTDEDCLYYGPYIQALEESPSPTINVNNMNSRSILDALGITREECPDLSGGMDAEAFLGRVLLAEAVAPTDPGRPYMDEPLRPGARGRWITCEREAGALHDSYLPRLREIAEFALAEGREVCWA